MFAKTTLADFLKLLRLWTEAIRLYVSKSNDRYRALCARKSAQKWLFYIFDFGA
jgi:hypothetical protein